MPDVSLTSGEVSKDDLQQNLRDCSPESPQDGVRGTLRGEDTSPKGALLGKLPPEGSDVVDSVSYENIVSDIIRWCRKKTPVSLLMELGQYLRKEIRFSDVGTPQGPAHLPRFTMTAQVDGCSMGQVSGATKRDCRNGSAFLAWNRILQDLQNEYKDQINLTSSASRKVALLSQLEYFRQVATNPLALCGKRVLAAILKRRPVTADADLDSWQVVSLGTGNRCIFNANMTLDGTTVNDCHAEILARRSFLRYLYREMEGFATGADSVFRRTPTTGRLAIQSGVTFHLYVSDSPCGDASLFTKSEDNTGLDPECSSPIYSSKNHGLLRTKIEAGEGTIPVVERGSIQTLVGLRFGGRLRIMSCSDKILKWNVCGLQGALLSHVMDPVYLDTVVLGDSFIRGHASRALHHRLTPTDDPLDLLFPRGYRGVNPCLTHEALEEGCPGTEKSTAVSVTWTLGDETTDVLDGTTGRIVCLPNKMHDGRSKPANRKTARSHTDEEPSSTTDLNPKQPNPPVPSLSPSSPPKPDAEPPPPPPNICKQQLYARYRKVMGLLGRHCDADKYGMAKENATAYQSVKRDLYALMERLGYGRWLKVPSEVDYFS